MWLLDTDHVTLLERGGIVAVSLRIRLSQVPAGELATTIISYEEQMRGWLSTAAQAKSPQQQVRAYALLQQHIKTFDGTPVWAYSELASSEFERFASGKSACRHQRPADCGDLPGKRRDAVDTQR